MRRRARRRRWTRVRYRAQTGPIASAASRVKGRGREDGAADGGSCDDREGVPRQEGACQEEQDAGVHAGNKVE